MLDLGWSEILTIAVVALIVVGPKELPALLRTVGKFMRVIRKQANEFRSQFDEAIKETELDEVRKEFQDLKSDVTATIRSAASGIEHEFRDLDGLNRDIDGEQKKSGTDTAASQSAAGRASTQEATFPEHATAESEWMDQYNNAVLAAEKHAKAGGDEANGPVREIASDTRPAANEQTAASNQAPKQSAATIVEKAAVKDHPITKAGAVT